MTISVFNLENKTDHTKAKLFLDPGGGVVIQRYDKLKYPYFDKLTDKQLGFFWRPEEVDILRDAKDFKQLPEHEKHIFTSNLKRQILLDSVQGRSPNLAFLPIVSVPELEIWVQTWAFNETIHSRSYTHIIRNVYPDPSIIFDELTEIQEIVDCAKDITKYYDQLIEKVQWYNLLGEGRHIVNGEEIVVSLKEIKKLLWLTIMSVNVLEGIRFYVSFACSWAFAESKKVMEGNAKIIKFICRDENVHLASTQTLLKMLPNDDEDFAEIKENSVKEAEELYLQAAEQEKAWAKYLFKDGSMLGLNEMVLCDYVEWITTKRMNSVGLKSPYKVSSNPLPWTSRWIAGSEVQVAPQETEISSYTIGAIENDLTDDIFSDVRL
ncbi:MAG: ribonucleotide-diphosphate reductase subunit beta [Candidatus Dojkabacteria bacterium]|nr:ribonucleotide-diphosphate reductase subunit beta [Candidatus Dojkabacteria bacterium]